MKDGCRFSCLALALLLALVTVPTMVDAADYNDLEEDPEGDVGLDDSLTLVEGYPMIDIISVSSSASDSDITVSLTIAGEFSPDAQYTVHIEADGNDRYSLRVIDGNFTGLSYVTFEPLSLEGTTSDDGKVLSWVIEKSEVPVSETLDVTRAMSSLQESEPMRTLIDVAPQYGPSPGDDRWDLIVELVSVTHLRQTAVRWVEYGDYEDFREYADKDRDGTVTQDEVDTVLEEWEGEPETEADWTCDGIAPERSEFRMEFDGLTGPVDSTEPFGFKEVHDLYYADVPEGGSHVYASSQWLAPKTNEDVRDDSIIRFVAPPGWEFDTTGWPSELEGFLNEDSTVLEIDGLTIRYNLVDVMGDVDSLTFTKGEGGDGDDSPGFGALATLAALCVLSQFIHRRRSGGWT